MSPRKLPKQDACCLRFVLANVFAVLILAARGQSTLFSSISVAPEPGSGLAILMPQRPSSLAKCPMFVATSYGWPEGLGIVPYSTTFIPSGTCSTWSYARAKEPGSSSTLRGAVSLDWQNDGKPDFLLYGTSGDPKRMIADTSGYTEMFTCSAEVSGFAAALDINRDSAMRPDIFQLGNSPPAVACQLNGCQSCAAIPGPWNAGLVSTFVERAVAAPLQGNGLIHLVIKHANPQLWIQNPFGAPPGFVAAPVETLLLRIGSYVDTGGSNMHHDEMSEGTILAADFDNDGSWKTAACVAASLCVSLSSVFLFLM